MDERRHMEIGHPDEGALLRLLSGEVDGEEREALLAHLGSCAGCAESMAELRAGADVAAAWIGLDVPPVDPVRRAEAWAAVQRAARPRRTAGAAPAWRRAAAAVAVVVAGAAVAEPAAAWLKDVLRVEGEEPEVTTPVERDVLAVAPSGVSFVPEDDALHLRLDHVQAQGRLTIRLASDPAVRLSIVDAAGAPSVTVLPGRVRVENAREDDADYELVIPTHLRLVTIRIGDAPEIAIPASGVPSEWAAVVNMGEVTRERTPLHQVN